ncbi:PREDICTED: uncharacterized protein LOC109300953 [Gavialis gangeticus]|uniref:uncharacterized protein LOC109300953 n=1 Tax=Gavialis gangeticus TaxID=94835 RepID=UPI00092EF7F1|nr:PREDICTED: uncharacterized protein LOC109300953 [Gavialis gangeticus]
MQEKLKMPQIHQMNTTDFQANKLKRASSTAKKPERRASSAKRIVFETQEKVKRIGPHLDIFEAFHGARRKTSFRKLVNAIVCIQRFVRGWLERIRYRRIKIKSESHGPSLSAVVKKYRKMLSRIKRRSGLLNLSTSLSFSELEEWMDKKTFYETMFAKREFWKEMDRSDLPGFLRDCGHFLSPHQIDEALRLVCPAVTTEGINGYSFSICAMRKNVMEMHETSGDICFMATQMRHQVTPVSTLRLPTGVGGSGT